MSASASAVAPAVSGARKRVPLAPVALTAGMAAVAAGNGSYFPAAWGWIGLGFAWAAALALTLGASAPARRELGWLAAWMMVVGWIWLSAIWTQGHANAISEGLRALTLPLAAAALLFAVQRGRLRAAVFAIAAGAALPAAYGLGTRLIPDRLGSYDAVAGARLAAPLGYWNALGALCVIGMLASVGAAVRSGAAGRAAAGVMLVVFAPTLYFTFSRGAWISLGVGLVAMLALDRHRLETAATTAALAIGPVIAVIVSSRSSSLTHANVSLAAAAHSGHRVALAVLAAAGVAALAGAASVPAGRRLTLTQGARRLGNAALALVALVALVGLVATAGGPSSLVHRADRAFAAPPPEIHGDLNKRLFNFSGSGRVPLWRAAVHDFEAHPVVGSGAGSYEAYWLAHRGDPGKVKDAHSLYLETLAELGSVGLLLLLVSLAVPLYVAVRVRRQPLVPALFGAYAAYLVHASVDWDWEVPAVTLAALLCGAAILVAARTPEDEARPKSARLQYALLAGTVALGVVAFLGLIGNLALARASNAAQKAQWTKAERDARSAIRWQPWSAQPWQQLGEAQLAQGRTAAAQVSFRAAIAKDSGDWNLWLDLARASTGKTQAVALARASRLNRLSPELAELKSELGSQSGISITATEGTP